MVVRGEQLVEVDFSRGLCSIVFHKAAIGELRTGRLTAIRVPGVLASKYRCSHYRWIEKLSFVEEDRYSSTRYLRSRPTSTDIHLTVFPVSPKVLHHHSRSSPKCWRSDRKLRNRKRWDEEFSESNAHRLARLKAKTKRSDGIESRVPPTTRGTASAGLESSREC